MKIGVRLKINVSEIEKARLFKGKKGVYLDATTFITLDGQDKYGQNGFITQDVTKEESDNNVKGPIIGNVTVFWQEEQPAQQQNTDTIPDDIPF